MANIDVAQLTTEAQDGSSGPTPDGPRSRPLPVLICGTFVIVLDSNYARLDLGSKLRSAEASVV